ncbi:MAG: class I SAM-dependent methyltransferase [Chloroflexia bacterium]
MDPLLWFRWIGWALLLALGVWLFFFLFPARLIRKIKPFPMPAGLARLLDNPLRRLIAPPEKALERMGLEPGMRTLEVGPGPGFWTLAAAGRVGPQGRVCAVEISPRLAGLVARKARRRGLSWVHVVVADARALPLAEGAFDHAFFVAVLGEVPDPVRALQEVRRVLRPGGRVAITEYLLDPDYSLPATMLRRAEQAGLRLRRRRNSLLGYTLDLERD